MPIPRNKKNAQASDPVRTPRRRRRAEFNRFIPTWVCSSAACISSSARSARNRLIAPPGTRRKFGIFRPGIPGQKSSAATQATPARRGCPSGLDYRRMAGSRVGNGNIRKKYRAWNRFQALGGFVSSLQTFSAVLPKSETQSIGVPQLAITACMAGVSCFTSTAL